MSIELSTEQVDKLAEAVRESQRRLAKSDLPNDGIIKIQNDISMRIAKLVNIIKAEGGQL